MSDNTTYGDDASLAVVGIESRHGRRGFGTFYKMRVEDVWYMKRSGWRDDMERAASSVFKVHWTRETHLVAIWCLGGVGCRLDAVFAPPVCAVYGALSRWF